MMPTLDIPRIRSAVELLDRVSPDTRLLHLKNLCINNSGIWAVPENPADYAPVHYEIGVFGVDVATETPADLPRTWMKAARNILRANDAGCAA